MDAVEPLLRVRNVSKSFGGLHALRNVSLSVPEGRVTGLIGPNGSGKSTLFEIISGFQTSDRSRIEFKGREIDGLPPHRIGRLGLIRTFQLSEGGERLTVLENLLTAFATLDPKMTKGMKGLSYATAGPRAADFTRSFHDKFGRNYTDAWAPPFYDAVWIVALAMNLANSLDSTAIRDAMWPAAYHYIGVSGRGDKGFNRWGMQHGEQNGKFAFVDGKIEPYYSGGSTDNIITFRYEDADGNPTEDGIPLAVAPSEEEFGQLYGE